MCQFKKGINTNYETYKKNKEASLKYMDETKRNLENAADVDEIKKFEEIKQERQLTEEEAFKLGDINRRVTNYNDEKRV